MPFDWISVAGLKLVGTDYTAGSLKSSTSQVELLDVDISADTVTNGILVTFMMAVSMDVTANTATLRMKAGTNGSETTYATVVFDSPGYDYAVGFATNELNDLGNERALDGVLQTYSFVVDNLDWTAAQTVSITMQFSDSDANNETRVQMLTVMGY